MDAARSGQFFPSSYSINGQNMFLGDNTFVHPSTVSSTSTDFSLQQQLSDNKRFDARPESLWESSTTPLNRQYHEYSTELGQTFSPHLQQGASKNYSSAETDAVSALASLGSASDHCYYNPEQMGYGVIQTTIHDTQKQQNFLPLHSFHFSHSHSMQQFDVVSNASSSQRSNEWCLNGVKFETVINPNANCYQHNYDAGLMQPVYSISSQQNGQFINPNFSNCISSNSDQNIVAEHRLPCVSMPFVEQRLQQQQQQQYNAENFSQTTANQTSVIQHQQPFLFERKSEFQYSDQQFGVAQHSPNDRYLARMPHPHLALAGHYLNNNGVVAYQQQKQRWPPDPVTSFGSPLDETFAYKDGVATKFVHSNGNERLTNADNVSYKSSSFFPPLYADISFGCPLDGKQKSVGANSLESLNTAKETFASLNVGYVNKCKVEENIRSPANCTKSNEFLSPQLDVFAQNNNQSSCIKSRKPKKVYCTKVKSSGYRSTPKKPKKRATAKNESYEELSTPTSSVSCALALQMPQVSQATGEIAMSVAGVITSIALNAGLVRFIKCQKHYIPSLPTFYHCPVNTETNTVRYKTPNLVKDYVSVGNRLFLETDFVSSQMWKKLNKFSDASAPISLFELATCSRVPLADGTCESESYLRHRLEHNLRQPLCLCRCLKGKKFDAKAENDLYYTHLAASQTIAEMRSIMEVRSGASGDAVRIEKVRPVRFEGKTEYGCPIAKWVIRRSSLKEKVLCVVRERKGHKCQTAIICIAIVVWDGVDEAFANNLYDFLKTTLPQYGKPTTRRCETNDKRTCACQGSKVETAGTSYSLGCAWSMYTNTCKYAKGGKTDSVAKKFELKETDLAYEESLAQNCNVLADVVSPVFAKMAPAAFRNQTFYSYVAKDCRLGNNPDSNPFSGITACVDFSAHAHHDLHNMLNGCTVVVTLTKHRGLSKPVDEQLHVLPKYALDAKNEYGIDGDQRKTETCGLEILNEYRMNCGVRRIPLPSAKERGAARKKYLQMKLGCEKVRRNDGGAVFDKAFNSTPNYTSATPPYFSQGEPSTFFTRSSFLVYETGVGANGVDQRRQQQQIGFPNGSSSAVAYPNQTTFNGSNSNYCPDAGQRSSPTEVGVQSACRATAVQSDDACKRKRKQTVENLDELFDPSNIDYSIINSKSAFGNANVGGVAIALGHGSILFEVAKRESHATTALKEPNINDPKRISLVFYQHKRMNFRRHGWYYYEATEKKRKAEQEKKKQEEAEAKRQRDAVFGESCDEQPKVVKEEAALSCDDNLLSLDLPDVPLLPSPPDKSISKKRSSLVVKSSHVTVSANSTAGCKVSGQYAVKDEICN